MTRGFTLIETLIALVIASMTAMVLLQSIIAIARSTEVIESAAALALSEEFTVSAASDALMATAADYLDFETAFTGTERTLSGLTRRPIFGPQATLLAFSMRLEPDGRGGTALIYEESGQRLEIDRFDQPDARFEYAYLTVTGLYEGEQPERLASWPPEIFDPFYDYFRPPPDLVLVSTPDGAVLWAARSNGWVEPPPRPSDVDEFL